jgi:hypothetical protein
MGQNKNFGIGMAVVAIIAVAGIALKFGTYLRFPPAKVIEPYGDGFKAYMSPAYHALYDSSLTHFQGMNYPYGDHLVFADPQPILANALQLFQHIGPGLLQATIHWTHLLMLLSILACAFLLFALFHRLGVPFWYAALAAPLLTFLSPMLARIGFHYGLAQPAAIPAVLLLLLMYQERPRWPISLGIGATVLFFSLFHFQYFGILVLGISAYFFVDFLYDPKREGLLKLIAHYSLQALLPFLLLSFWLNSGNPIEDRASKPFGFLHYRSNFAGTFTSPDQPHLQFVSKWTGDPGGLDIEARNYIGLIAGFGLWIFLVILLKSRKKALLPGHFENPAAEPFVRRIFWSGLLLYLFSTGFPFTLSDWERFTEYLGPLRQFRAIGRFSWFFFFTANIVVLTWIGRLPVKKAWMQILCLGILAAESFFFLRARDLHLDDVAGLQPGATLLEQTGINPADYQAILPIPYFHIGSDNFWVEPEGFIQQNAMVLSLQSGLPLCGVMMSRTSVGQTYRQLQLVSEPYRYPIILEDYPNTKPLLMLVDEERFRRDAPRWDHFSSAATGVRFLKDLGRLKVYAVPLSFFKASADRKREIVATQATTIPLHPRDSFLLSDSTSFIAFRTWDKDFSTFKYAGQGGFSGNIHLENTLFDEALPHRMAGERCIFSVWMYLNDDMRGTTICTLREYAPKTGEALSLVQLQVGQHARVFDSNGWALVEIPFESRSTDTHVQISFQNTEAKGPLYLDELLIRPEGVDVFRKKPNGWWKNNRFYPDPANTFNEK